MKIIFIINSNLKKFLFLYDIINNFVRTLEFIKLLLLKFIKYIKLKIVLII